MYRATGPEEMRPVGQTEFVTGMAAMSESGAYGPTRVAAGIVGFADLTLGDRVEPVLEAHVRAGGGRFRGVRHSAAWDASDVIGNSQTAHGPHLFRQSDFRAGLAPPHRARPLLRRVDVSSPARRHRRSGARRARGAPSSWATCGGPLGYGPYAGKRDEVFAAWKAGDHRARHVPERDHEARRHDDAARRLATTAPCPRRRPRPSWRRSGAPISRRASSCSARRAACSRATSPWRRWGSAGRPVERAQAHRRGRVRRGEARAVQRHGPAGLPARLNPAAAVRRGPAPDPTHVP